MAQASRPSADYYRQKANEIKKLASTSRSAAVRLELLQIAELFERLADRVQSLSTTHPIRVLCLEITKWYQCLY